MKTTKIVGILNCTPDSFYDGANKPNSYFIEKGHELLEEGADLLDVGGESTRPGAQEISVLQEVERTAPIIEALSKRTHKILSIDTRKAAVAQAAIRAGAGMINDVSGLTYDSNMPELVSQLNCPVVIMHSRGTPEVMNQYTDYGENFMETLVNEMKERITKALNAGVRKRNIIIDPGIGFAKSKLQNWLLLNNLEQIKSLDLPIYIGHSRKSFLKQDANENNDDRLAASLVVSLHCAKAGVDYLRVHDVRATKNAIRTMELLNS